MKPRRTSRGITGPPNHPDATAVNTKTNTPTVRKPTRRNTSGPGLVSSEPRAQPQLPSHRPDSPPLVKQHGPSSINNKQWNSVNPRLASRRAGDLALGRNREPIIRGQARTSRSYPCQRQSQAGWTSPRILPPPAWSGASPEGERSEALAAGAGTGRPELADELKALLPDELLDELLAGARTEEEITGRGGLLSQLTKRLVERALEVELTDHLGYEPHQEPPGGAGNTRNGSTPKTLITEHGEVRIETPRDRAGDVRAADRAGSGSGGSRGSTTRSSRSTAAACRPATSRRTWRRSTGSRSAAT